MAIARKISLVLADVDGTLVTEDKVLTRRARAAVAGLRAAGIRFAITSGRPPRGMAMLVEPLGIDTAMTGFNGGLTVAPDLTILDRKLVPPEVAARAFDLIRHHGLDVWVYRGHDWLVGKKDAPHVSREAWTVKFEPEVMANLGADPDGISKIVGISDDLDRVAACEAEAQAAFGDRATAARSQPYYLDVTSHEANKGAVVDDIIGRLGDPGGGDRHARRPAQRRGDVRTFGPQHRDGQRLRRGQVEGDRGDGVLQRRRLRQGGGTIHPGRTLGAQSLR